MEATYKTIEQLVAEIVTETWACGINLAQLAKFASKIHGKCSWGCTMRRAAKLVKKHIIKSLLPTFAVKNELPELQGTEARVAWANDIRDEALNTVSNKQLLAVDRLPEDNPAAQKVLEAAQRKMLTETCAKWWIDNKYNVNLYIYRQLKAESIRQGRKA